MTGILVRIDAGIHVGWYGTEGAPSATIPGYGPSGSATLVLDLGVGTKVRLEYSTDIIKTRSGKEQRISRNDVARESYSGPAILLGDAVLEARDTLAKYATLGWPFLLGLMHEALHLRADASGATVYVVAAELALVDWTNEGQRVVVAHENDDGDLEWIDAVVQSADADSITLDVAPGELGAYGGMIMPTRAIYLEPEQDFARSEAEDAETWQVEARASTFDYSPTHGTIPLEAVLPSAPAGAILMCREATTAPRYIDLYPNLGWPADGLLSEAGPITTWKFRPGVTTLGDLADALAASSNFILTGSYNPATTLGAMDEGLFESAGAAAAGPVGTGATLTEYADRPVWDYPIVLEGSITDSIHAMTEIIDFGGAIYAKGFADMPEGGRAVTILSGQRAEWQWFKLFLSTVKGRQKAFWLSTWRSDLEVVSVAAEYITVRGDVAAWYPRQRQHIHVREADGSDVYCQINDAIDNGDGTWELQTDAAPFTDPRKVSWLELVRFNSDDFEATWGQRGFRMVTTARVVQQ